MERAEKFKKRIEALIEKIEDLIDEMPYRGDSEKESQKVYLLNQLNEFSYAVNGIKESDLKNK